MDYFQKIENQPVEDLIWNIPEQKQGSINIVGGSSQSFRTEVKTAEYMSNKYPIKDLHVILPDALRTKMPPLSNFVFLSSTESGSLADGDELMEVLNAVDYNLLLGDFSKNAITAKAVASACSFSEKPLMLTRDTVDLIAGEMLETILVNKNVTIFASVLQLQKLSRTIYYPKMLLVSQSLVRIAEVLHKFTLSYPISIITLHGGQILISKNGLVKVVSLDKSGFSPISFWQGELAAKIVAMNLYNPDNFMAATVAAILM